MDYPSDQGYPGGTEDRTVCQKPVFPPQRIEPGLERLEEHRGGGYRAAPLT